VVKKNGQAEKIQNASQLPDTSELKEIKEPWIKVSIFSPLKFLGGVFRLLEQTRAKFLGQKHYGSHVNLQFKMPLIELIKGFYDQLKSVSSGFASLNYRVIGFEAFDAARLDVFINREKIDALSLIIDKEEGRRRAGRIARKLKEVVPPQLFEVPIQIALNGRVISRETIRAQRKDVTAKLYGGDQTRKDKLLKKQKKGKKRLKEVGKITLPQEAFLSVLGR